METWNTVGVPTPPRSFFKASKVRIWRGRWLSSKANWCTNSSCIDWTHRALKACCIAARAPERIAHSLSKIKTLPIMKTEQPTTTKRRCTSTPMAWWSKATSSWTPWVPTPLLSARCRATASINWVSAPVAKPRLRVRRKHMKTKATTPIYHKRLKSSAETLKVHLRERGPPLISK